MPALKFNPDGKPHTHIWIRRPKTGGGSCKNQFACAYPGCFTLRNRTDLFGAETLCAVCHKEKFVLNWKSLLLAKPRCDKCSQTASAKEKRGIQKLLEEMGIG